MLFEFVTHLFQTSWRHCSDVVCHIYFIWTTPGCEISNIGCCTADTIWCGFTAILVSIELHRWQASWGPEPPDTATSPRILGWINFKIPKFALHCCTFRSFFCNNMHAMTTVWETCLCLCQIATTHLTCKSKPGGVKPSRSSQTEKTRRQAVTTSKFRGKRCILWHAMTLHTLLHSTLRTLQSKLYTLHLTHFTHFTHFTHYTPHSILYTLHSTLYTPHSTLYTLHSTLHTLFALHALHSTLCTLHLHSKLHTLHSTFHTSHFTLYTPHSELYTPHFTLHTSLYTLHFTLHTLHSTLHTLHSTL